MSRDPYIVLGLAPGAYAPQVIERRYESLRREALADLVDPGRRQTATRRLDALYLAYRALRENATSPSAHSLGGGSRDISSEDIDQAPRAERANYLRQLIYASLEGDLIRHARRREIVDEGRRLGFSDFHTQLLIAEVQFGERSPFVMPDQSARRRSAPAQGGHQGALVRLATAGALGVSVFVALSRWLAL